MTSPAKPFGPALLSWASRGLATVAGASVLLMLAGAPASAVPDLCVSSGGTERAQKGTASCSSVAGPGNVAIAHGSRASAVAGLTDGDERNRAKALSDDAIAVAGEGDGNAATASGGAVGAVATNGDNNSATASGTNSAAVANFGSDNRVRVSGNDSAAVVSGGNRNTITVSSDNCAVAVTFGDDIRDTC